MRYLLSGAAALALIACGEQEPSQTGAPAEDASAETMADDGAEAFAEAVDASAEERLDAALAEQSEETKARYQYRHPKETLTFFGVEPGMTVVEALPGGGWYSSILIDYLGPDGRLVGANYAYEMWPLFGPIFSEGFVESQKTWEADWPAQMREASGEGAPEIAAFQFGAMPEDMRGEADAVLFIRALHNLARFEDEGQFLTQAIADAKAVLKPGGTVGVVQHRAPEANSDEWASGDAGYLKQQRVIDIFENAGFEFVDSAEINANPDDQPTEEDVVWRLPPSLATSREDEELKAQMQAVGESDRMTLKFRLPE